MSHVLFLILLHGRGLFRLVLKLGTLVGAIAMFALSITHRHAGAETAGRGLGMCSGRSCRC